MSEHLDFASAHALMDYMNQRHADELLDFAKVYGRRRNAVRAEMVEIDDYGLELRVGFPDHSPESVHIVFPHPLQSFRDAHDTLLRLAETARRELSNQP